jgi:predicted transposase YbfD/YdcC
MARKRTEEFYTEVDQIADREAFLESVQEGFNKIEDPRAKDNQTYPLVHLLVMILCAILAGANTILDIYDYAHLKLKMFQKILQIEEAPSYSVFWWLLTRLNPNQLENSLIRWIQALPEDDKERLMAIDGKYLKGVSRNQKIHLVSVWDSTRSLLLGQIKAKEKSNEITAIPELLNSIDLKNATVTIDAAGCQTEIVEKIREGGGNYVIALKGNQGTLKAKAENFFIQARDVGHQEADCAFDSSCEKGHGRIEEREIVVTNQLNWLSCKLKWKDLTSLIEVTSRRMIGEKTCPSGEYA